MPDPGLLRDLIHGDVNGLRLCRSGKCIFQRKKPTRLNAEALRKKRVSLIPALGNMVANTVMAFLCLPHGAPVVLAAVVFLILVHKAEYIINAKIIGQNVKASVPAMLIAILIGERLFGLPGLMLGPVSYAYLKMYLIQKRLI